MREIVISKNEAGQRLNKLVMKYLNKAPSSFVYRMIRKKNIKLNGGKVTGITLPPYLRPIKLCYIKLLANSLNWLRSPFNKFT